MVHSHKLISNEDGTMIGDEGQQPHLLSFLAISREMRETGMRSEFESELNRDARNRAWKAFGKGVIRPWSRTSWRDEAAYKLHVIARSKIDEWIKRDATDKLVATLTESRPFALYLRAHAAEGFDALVHDSGGPRLALSVEIGNLGRIFDNGMPVFGLRNVLDVNLAQKYGPVWVPAPFRKDWRAVIYVLAKLSKLIVINATRPGRGLAAELEIVPREFPEKTWLIAGFDEQTGRYVSRDIGAACAALERYQDRVSRAIQLSDGTTRFGEPQLPNWVRDIVEASRRWTPR